jgi:hypothetical protein
VAAPGFNTHSKMPCLYWRHCGMMENHSRVTLNLLPG